MPVQITDTTVLINYSAINETLIIAPDVNAGGGVNSAVDGSTLVNYGNILRAGSTAAYFGGHDAVVHNMAGALISGSSGVNLGFEADLLNEGTIDGYDGYGILAGSFSLDVTIENSGSISGKSMGIFVNAQTAAPVSITNSGTITGGSNGVRLAGGDMLAPVIINSGTIKGGTYSILADTGDQLNVLNTGTLIGHVRGHSAGQIDSVTNNKTIIGNVSLGGGNDLYKGTGTVSAWVFGEDGIDALSGGNSVDRFDGGLGNDTLTGNGGNDILKGGSGNDVIFGGLGVDNLTGGANTDYFVFNTAPNTATNRDIVVDFSHADDAFRMENAIFTRLGAAGLLNPAFFRAGAAALDGNDYIVYNPANGALMYDSNGNLAGGLVGLAVLTNKPALAFNDFAVI